MVLFWLPSPGMNGTFVARSHKKIKLATVKLLAWRSFKTWYQGRPKGMPLKQGL